MPLIVSVIVWKEDGYSASSLFTGAVTEDQDSRP
jgi:hypothetical protein